MTEPSKPQPWYDKLPARIVGVVVFLVALTTLLGNLLELRRESAALVPSATTPAPVTVASTPEPAPAVQPPRTSGRFALQLDRIVVRHDGSLGATDWRFAVEADEQPLFVLSQDDLDDTGGRNVALPRDVRTTMRLPDSGKAVLAIKAWRGAGLRLASSHPEATGSGVIEADGAVAPIVVAADDPGKGEFVLHFSATPLEATP